ncbi:MAG: DUF3365 domain-containing protein [Propionivibrio sp.]|uniref:c-type heme family protein n=1 Tax=Propionivibrio sp. TaxID=2212460 RepID=UPI001B5F0762|nr:DUF3365 domain-containing protein [Propionivibrio sp.]MBP7203269.1 DUF3365 domain-containing protein [Propionivibrio sp.]
MKLRTRMWMILGVTLLVILGGDLAITWRQIQDDQRSELEIDVHTIRGILMATRRVYHQQFIQSGLPVTEATVGFLPAHAMARISTEYKAWTENGYRFNNVSDRSRNPANRADAFELAAMDFYRSNPQVKERSEPIVERNGKRWFHYTAPIWVEGYCLKCHGAESAAPASIRRAYPAASYDYKIGDLRGVMSIRLPMERYDAMVAQRFRSDLIRDGLTLLCTFLVLGYFMDRFVLRRIESLRATARRVAEGDLGARVNVRGSDELTELAADFNHMTEAVEARIVEVRDLNAALETRVAERTTELAAAKIGAEAASEAKSAFLSNTSHEIRTPLNAILGLTHLMRNEATPTQVERLGKIDAAGKHLLSIINDILDISKIEAGKLQLEHSDFPLPDVLDHVRSILGEAARAKGLEIRIDTEGVPVWLRGDVMRLRQALLNYAGNALKFTQHGHITLAARLLEDCGDDLLIRFSVSDTGVGIDAARLPQLFEAFAQADVSTTREFGGTGLGLSITRRLAELMGGEAGAESTPGGGSTFWFTARVQRGRGILPPVAVPPADAERQLRERPSPARLLLAEDNDINCEVALELLHSVGLTVDVAADGRVALELARRQRYDLVLMDVQMPHLNGMEATRAIRALPGWQDVPILAMTANAFDEDRQAAELAGMNDHVAKPVDPDQLFALLVKWLPPAVPSVRAGAGAAAPVTPAPVEPDADEAVRARLACIPGLDVEAGLRFFNGRLPSYLRLVQLFVTHHKDDVERMAELIGRGELVSAAEIVHTLKGSTGNLGAQAIHSRLNELHEALRARDDAAVQSALQPLAERFPRLIASLQAALWSA